MSSLSSIDKELLVHDDDDLLIINIVVRQNVALDRFPPRYLNTLHSNVRC